MTLFWIVDAKCYGEKSNPADRVSCLLHLLDCLLLRQQDDAVGDGIRGRKLDEDARWVIKAPPSFATNTQMFRKLSAFRTDQALAYSLHALEVVTMLLSTYFSAVALTLYILSFTTLYGEYSAFHESVLKALEGSDINVGRQILANVIAPTPGRQCVQRSRSPPQPTASSGPLLQRRHEGLCWHLLRLRPLL